MKDLFNHGKNRKQENTVLESYFVEVYLCAQKRTEKRRIEPGLGYHPQ